MKSSTLLTFAFAGLLLSASYSHALGASTESNRLEAPVKLNEIELKRLTDRLEEIKSMPLKSLTRKERRELRHEVKTIERALKANSNGVYLSVGAVIIIALLLILIL
ncbi:MAG: hypothetical protein MUF68_06260 [Cyclobacteriaceae bacterium]|nr:hypothetical protein [Cyclobacteriaceae bacterium]